jgi:hypothetical protein
MSGPHLVRMRRPGSDELGRSGTADRERQVAKTATCATCGSDLWPGCTGHGCRDGFKRHTEPGAGGTVDG